MPIELSTAVKEALPFFEFRKKHGTVEKLAEKAGVDPVTIRRRCNHILTQEKAGSADTQSGTNPLAEEGQAEFNAKSTSAQTTNTTEEDNGTRP